MNLDDLLLDLGIGYREAAKRARIGRSTLYRWVYGRSRPQNEQLAKLAKALGLSPRVVRDAVDKSRAATAAGR